MATAHNRWGSSIVEVVSGETCSCAPLTTIWKASSTVSTRSHRYTRRVVLIITLAQTEARRLHSERINTEHLLLALLREPNGAGQQVLRNLGVRLDRVRQMSQSVTSPQSAKGSDTGLLTLQARKALELAGEEARHLGHPNTGTEHVLLGLLREGSGIAALVLGYNSVTLALARAETERLRASGHRIDEALPDREAARTLRAQMVTRQGFPYQPSEAAPAAPSMFAPEARALLARAHACALRANRASIGAEHLLLALLEEPRGRPARLLRSMGVDLARLVALLQAYGGQSARIPRADPTLTAHARKIVAGAVDESLRLRQDQVSAEHFLLSVLRDGQGLALSALRRVGVEPRQLYERTRKVLSSAPGEP